MEVTSEVAAGDAAGNYVITYVHRLGRRGQQLVCHPDHHGSGHHSARFTFVPADYTVECSDEILMDNAGRRQLWRGDRGGVKEDTWQRHGQLRDHEPSPPRTMRTRRPPQTITVQDTSAPEFSFVPADVVVECTDAWPEDMALASDACGPVDIQVTTDTLPGFCGLLRLERTFTATDDAGNANTVVQTLTQVDTQGPVSDVEEGFVLLQNFSKIPFPARPTRAQR